MGPHGLNSTATARGNNTLDAAAAPADAEPSFGTDGGELICMEYGSCACNVGVRGVVKQQNCGGKPTYIANLLLSLGTMDTLCRRYTVPYSHHLIISHLTHHNNGNVCSQSQWIRPHRPPCLPLRMGRHLSPTSSMSTAASAQLTALPI
jgi:hypothetical protein